MLGRQSVVQFNTSFPNNYSVDLLERCGGSHNGIFWGVVFTSVYNLSTLRWAAPTVSVVYLITGIPLEFSGCCA